MVGQLILDLFEVLGVLMFVFLAWCVSDVEVHCVGVMLLTMLWWFETLVVDRYFGDLPCRTVV